MTGRAPTRFAIWMPPRPTGLSPRVCADAFGNHGLPERLGHRRDQPLTELGMDSLMAVRIRNTARGDFGVEPPVALLLQGASLQDLTADLIRQLGLAGRTPPRTGTAFAIEPSSVPQRGNEPRCGER